ncbi:flavin-containing monooxygenase [Nocardia carnea]|uniref:flavin-containing monooxygenase n=1 Tax=Nocardia carnea TaxID=37328 RepID=UPI002454B4EC|nr:NAD(P)/FAD-dependent oxidoreductase [Nocardia carnea]
MAVISPTQPTYIVSPVAEVDPDVLAAAVEAAEPGALLMALVHLTGDTGLLEEFQSELEAERQRVETEGLASPIQGEYPDSVAAQVREGARELLGTSLYPSIAVPDDELFRRMAEVCVNDTVGEEYVQHLREQAGFEAARPVVPRRRTPPEDFTVAIIGAGMIGLNAAIKLGEAGFRYQVFEERDDLGGTWSRNVYPGAAVDTPSHFYSYSFELNPRWSKYYPTGPEYLDYMRGVARKYDLYPHISFATKVLACEWHDDEQMWHVTVRDSQGSVHTHRANAVVTATGVLNGAFIPEFEGMDTFRGEMMHTAQWREDVDLTGKRVVILGTGCTAVQVVASIAEQVASLDVVLRQPHWVVPEQAVAAEVSSSVRWALEHIPYYHQWFRLKSYWWASDKGWVIPRIDEEWYATHVSASPANDAVMQVCLDYLDRMFADRPDLKEKLTPDFPPFAKRIVKDPGFFEAIKRDNVSVHRASFREIHPDGVVTTEGEFIAADVIIWATGFKLEYLGFLDVAGRGGRKLAEEWADENPRAYLGITVPGFPNFFVTAGPNAAPNHGGGHNITSEEHVHYVVESLQYLIEHGHAAMEPKRTATDEYNRRVDEELDKTVWQHARTANGYYRNKAGRAWITCPWRLVDYWAMLRAPEPEDYVFTAGVRH